MEAAQRPPPNALALDQVRNAAPGHGPTLDLSGSTLSPWQGAGSQRAIVAVRGTERWRVKATADGASSAMEVAFGKLFQLTGLLAPDTELVGTVDGLQSADLHVGSRYEPHFQDLGDFLLSDAAVNAVAADDPLSLPAYEALRTRHANAVAANSALLGRAGVEWWALGAADAAAHAANDQDRFNALDAMNRLLPGPLRSEQVRHFIAARWLDDWDHLNYRMENFGYTQRDGHWVGMSLDFGSCGPLGFRDPQTGAMLPKRLSRQVAVAQRPPSLFPIPERFAANTAGFDAMQADPGALHDTTCWPYGFQSESIAALFRPPAAAHPGAADTLAEMAYRLALLPPAAIEDVIARYWPALAPDAARDWPQAAALAQQMNARRDALVARFDRVQISDWIHANPTRAARVRRDIGEAIQAVLGASAAATHQPDVQRRHDALLPPADSTGGACINGVCSETRAMQQFHHAVLQLDGAGLSAVTALMSAPLHAQLLRHLVLGPGRTPHAAAAFSANHDWLVLMRHLVDAGQADPGAVARLLLTPVAAGAYPPEVAAWSEKHPELGVAFIRLLEALLEQGLPARQLRLGLLAAKRPGTPNYYAGVMASASSGAWIERLQSAQLWPGPQDLQEVKSWRSRTAFGLRSRLPRGQTPIAVRPQAHAVQRMALRPLVAHLRQAYGPESLVALELALLRQEVVCSVRLVHRDELHALSTAVAKAVETAWAEATQRHGLPRTSVPAAFLEGQQQQARSRFEGEMWGLRGAAAEALIARAADRYREELQDRHALDADARLALFRAGVAAAVGDIHAMVAAAGQADAPAVDQAAVGEQVRRRVQAESVEQALQARVQAQLRQRVAHSAAAQAGKQAQAAAAARAERAASAQAQRTAALLVFEKATQEARQAARLRATQEASARAARVSEAKVENLAARLQSLKNLRRDEALAERLARLRAPVGQATALRAAELLDANGRPGIAHL